MLLFISAFVITTEMKESIAHAELLAMMDSEMENTITFSCVSNGESKDLRPVVTQIDLVKTKGSKPSKGMRVKREHTGKCIGQRGVGGKCEEEDERLKDTVDV